MVKTVTLVNRTSTPLTIYQDGVKVPWTLPIYVTNTSTGLAGIPVYEGGVISVVSGTNVAVLDVKKVVTIGDLDNIYLNVVDNGASHANDGANQSIMVGLVDAKTYSTMENPSTRLSNSTYVPIDPDVYFTYVGTTPLTLNLKHFLSNKLSSTSVDDIKKTLSGKLPAPASGISWLMIILIIIVLIIGIIIGVSFEKFYLSKR
jgi:hypothetical protein